MKIQDGKTVANEFINKLKARGFAMSRSKNSGTEYTLAEQKKDTDAVEKFLETDLFQDVMDLK